MTATTISTGLVQYRGEEYWVVNSCVNRVRMLYIVLRATDEQSPEARRDAIAQIEARGWELWYGGWCMVNTPQGKVEWRARGRRHAVPSIAEIEAKLTHPETDDERPSAFDAPEFCVGGEWVPESDCQWVTKKGGESIRV